MIAEDVTNQGKSVFYNGFDSPYPYTTDIMELFADKDLINSVSLGKFKLIDLTIMPEYEILKHKQLALLEMCLKHIKNRDFVKIINYVLDSLIVAHENHLSKDLFDSTISYLAKAREYSELQPLFDEIIENISDYKEDIMTYAEELMQRGEQMAQISMVQEMIRSGLELALIEKISHLNKKEIEKIKETMH